MNQPQINEEQQKKHQTSIKSAQGAVGIMLVMNLVYIIRALITKNLDFWFSLYTTQFLIKKSSFVEPYDGGLAKWLSIVLIVLSIALLASATAFSQKKPQALYACLALYGADTVFLIVGTALNLFGDFSEGSFIDIIIHAFVIAFVANGIYGYNKLKCSKTQSEE